VTVREAIIFFFLISRPSGWGLFGNRKIIASHYRRISHLKSLYGSVLLMRGIESEKRFLLFENNAHVVLMSFYAKTQK